MLSNKFNSKTLSQMKLIYHFIFIHTQHHHHHHPNNKIYFNDLFEPFSEKCITKKYSTLYIKFIHSNKYFTINTIKHWSNWMHIFFNVKIIIIIIIFSSIFAFIITKLTNNYCFQYAQNYILLGLSLIFILFIEFWKQFNCFNIFNIIHPISINNL